MIKIISASLMSMFFLLLMVSSCIAAECEYGSVHACARISDDPWEDATTHPMLKRSESFQIQIQVITKTDLSVFFLKLHEYGTPVYEVLEGPMGIEQLFEYRGVIYSGQIFTYTWKIRVRPNTTWVNGYAPLELFVQLNKDDTDECRINFDIVTAYILDESLGNSSRTIPNEDGPPLDASSLSQPGFDFGPSIVTVFFLVLFVRWGIHHRRS